MTSLAQHVTEPLIDMRVFKHGHHLAPCQYMELRDNLLNVDEAAAKLGISVDELKEYCSLKLVPHALIGRGLRFLKSLLEGVTAESLNAAHKEKKKSFISAVRYVPQAINCHVEDCRVLAFQHRLPWASVKRLLESGAITGKKTAAYGKWVADEQSFVDECNKLGRKAFQITRTKGVPCTATPDERHKMLKKQRGLCACCGDKPAKLCVDHDHENGAMRKGLCVHCNAGIGHFRDDPQRLEKAIAYLRRHGK